MPTPTLADENLKTRGNIIWNGPADHSLGIDGDAASLVRSENAINTLEPELIDPKNGNFRPAAGGNVFGVTTYPIPAFAGGVRAQPPLAPEGNLNNDVVRDYDGNTRSSSSPPGAFIRSTELSRRG